MPDLNVASVLCLEECVVREHSVKREALLDREQQNKMLMFNLFAGTYRMTTPRHHIYLSF